METVTRQVGALQPAIRSAMEAVVGHALQADQQIVIQVLDPEPVAKGVSKGSKLPDWCGIFADLTAEEEAALASSIAGRSESRSAPAP